MFQTRDSWLEHARPTLALILLVALVYPSSFSQLSQDRSTAPSTSALATPNPPPPASHAESFTVGANLPLPDVPVTLHEGGIVSARVEQEKTQTQEEEAMKVKGATRQDDNTSLSWSTTPPISPPPRAKRSGGPVDTAPTAEESTIRISPVRAESGEGTLSTSSEPEPEKECPIDFRGRRLCETREAPYIRRRRRSNELAEATSEFGTWVLDSVFTLGRSLLHSLETSPFVLAILLLSLLCGVQLASLIVRLSTSFRNRAVLKMGYFRSRIQ